MLEFLMNYWYVVAIVLLVAVLFLLKKVANVSAKAMALKYLLAFQSSVFKTSDVEVGVAAHAAYLALPSKIKLFVPEAIFETIVAEMYAEVKKLIAELEANNDNQNEKK